MHRIRFAAKALLLLSLSACGDAREEFSGNYGFTGQLKLGVGTNQESFPVQGQLDVIADHFNDKRLYVNWDCGLNTRMEDEAVALVQKNCPTFRSGNCEFSYRYATGSARVEGNKLTINFSGNVAAWCREGSGTIPLALELSGERGKIMPAPQPGQQDLGGEPGPAAFQGTTLLDALKRSIEPSGQGE